MSFFSPSPNGPSSYQLSYTQDNNKYFDCCDSSTLEKSHKSLSFSDVCHVATIPPRHECLQPDMDLWWTHKDFVEFKQKRLQEHQAGLDLVCCNFQKTQAKDELVDIKILIVSNESLLSSSLTQNLACALSIYEKELNQQRVSEIEQNKHTDIPYKRVRSSVTRASHYSKDYASAVEGASRDLPYNVVIFDSGRAMATTSDQKGAIRGSIGDDDIDLNPSANNSIIVNKCSVTTAINMTPLLMRGSFDVPDICFDENYLLRKIIKSGAALCYICDDSSNSCCTDNSDDTSSVSLADSHVSIPIQSHSTSLDCASKFSSPSAQSILNSHLRPLPSTYSLLKDHADVVVLHDQTNSNSSTPPLLSPSDSSPLVLEGELTVSRPGIPPPKLTCRLESSHPQTVDDRYSYNARIINKSCEKYRVLSVDDWLFLFHLAIQRDRVQQGNINELNTSSCSSDVYSPISIPCCPGQSLLTKALSAKSS